MRRTFISKFPNANLPLISINLEFVKWGNSDLFVGSHELLKYLRRVQPAPSMTSLVCSDPSKMVCSDPPRMVCSDPKDLRVIILFFKIRFAIHEKSLLNY